MNIHKSIIAFKEAKEYISGGVNSPVRSFMELNGDPLFIKKGKGAYIWDIDDNMYIDFCLSWGALILGHTNQAIINEIQTAISNGTSFGCPTLSETKLAKITTEAFPSVEKTRFVNSGTEATMSAIRLARGYTGRNKIIKFDGCYHGHSDNLLIKAGSGVSASPSSSSSGVPENIISDTLSLPFNDIGAFEHVIENNYKDIACVIIEPVPANMGLIIPKPGYLDKIRELTQKYNIVLIFDEVITGFRLAFGGAQEYFGVKPDLTCMGKIIGGGFPVGAFGGKSEIMDSLTPQGNVYQAGTLSGNPVAVSAGIAMLRVLKNKSVYKELNDKMLYVKQNLRPEININTIGSVFYLYFNYKGPISRYNDILQCDRELFINYHQYLLKNGIYISPSQFEVNFLSTAHSSNDLNHFIEVTNKFCFENAAKVTR